MEVLLRQRAEELYAKNKDIVAFVGERVLIITLPNRNSFGLWLKGSYKSTMDIVVSPIYECIAVLDALDIGILHKMYADQGLIAIVVKCGPFRVAHVVVAFLIRG